MTLLMEATACDHRALVDLLIERGADVNKHDTLRVTALHSPPRWEQTW